MSRSDPGDGTCDRVSEPERVVLSVRDNGVDIPAEYHDAIFEPRRRRMLSKTKSPTSSPSACPASSS